MLVESRVDWSRVAEPQADGYDSVITLEFAAQNGYTRPSHQAVARFLGNAVALLPDATVIFPDDYELAPSDHFNVERAEQLIRLWPDGFEQCQRLLDSVTVFKHRGSFDDYVIGSVCGPGSRGFGSVAVTVDNHVGFAEGLVHEMGHHKLTALGVQLETTQRLLVNDPSVRFPSPIRYDCLRPMSAVLHAQYSYTYILALDLAILRANLDLQRDQCIAERSLAIIAPKLRFGMQVIRAHAAPDRSGELFLTAFGDWVSRVVNESEQFLRRFNVPEVPFEHPLL